MKEHDLFLYDVDDGLLPSWKDGHARRGIIEFVREMTAEASPGLVPPAQRIALFSHDGVLGCEHPVCLQDAFVVSQIEALAPGNPSLLNLLGALAGGAIPFEPAPLDAIRAALPTLNAGQFSALVAQWFATAEHPYLKRPFDQLIYRPMLELIEYLRQNDFCVQLVCRGDEEFMRVIASSAYGIEPEHVISAARRNELQLAGAGGDAALITMASKSDADVFGPAAVRPAERSLSLLLLHDDAEREFGYHEPELNSESAGARLVSMRNDWKTVFTPEPAAEQHALSNPAWQSKAPVGKTRSVSSARTSMRNISVRVA